VGVPKIGTCSSIGSNAESILLKQKHCNLISAEVCFSSILIFLFSFFFFFSVFLFYF
jgi:hypothetical protein